MKGGASAPALHLSAASKRALLAVDLAASDPALASGGTGVGGKRLRVSAMDDGEEEEEEDDGHAGGRGGFVHLLRVRSVRSRHMSFIVV